MMYEVNPGLVIQLLNFFRQIGYLQMLIRLLKTQNFWCELWFWYLYLCDNKPKGLQLPPPRHLFPRFHLARHLLPRDFSSIQNASGSPAVEKKHLKNSHVKYQMAANGMYPLPRMPVRNPKPHFRCDSLCKSTAAGFQLTVLLWGSATGCNRGKWRSCVGSPSRKKSILM